MLGLNNFEVYQELGNGNSSSCASMYSNYEYSLTLPFERIGDPRAITLFLQRNWHHTISVGILYYALIRLIQWAMGDRKAFDLRGPLCLWNSALAVFSICGLIRFSEEPLYNLIHHGFTYTLCHPVNPDGTAAFWAVLFFFSKLVEFGDTLFIVLRKRKLIFLHYYHHAAVLVYSAHVGAEHTAAMAMFVPMNFLAHSLMYSYYALAALGLKIPRKVAMLVTSVQTAQMLAGVAVTGFVLKAKLLDGTRCHQSMGNLYLAILLYSTFAFLFIQFFCRAYFPSTNANGKKTQETVVKNSEQKMEKKKMV